MTTAKHIGTDQNRQDEATTFWFEVTGHNRVSATYGIVEGRNPGVVYDDGDPVLNGWERGEVQRVAIVTDEMRSGA